MDEKLGAINEGANEQEAGRVNCQSAMPCYMAELGLYANVNCPNCNNPMLYDFDHIRCTTVDCDLRGKKFQKPMVRLEAI